MNNRPKVLILRMRHVLFIDATGIYRLKEIINKFKENDRKVILSEVKPEILEDLMKGEVFSVLDKKNLVLSIENEEVESKKIIKKQKKMNKKKIIFTKIKNR